MKAPLLQDSFYNHALHNQYIKRKTGKSGAWAFGIWSKAYHFTNEYLEKLIEEVSHKNAHILGILSSGDHLLCSAMEGCASYAGIDISLYSCFYSELKISAVSNLSYPDFIDFFAAENNQKWTADLTGRKRDTKISCGLFNKRAYDLLRKDLSNAAKQYFDSTIGFVYPYSLDIRLPLPLDSLRHLFNREEMKSIPYLKDESHYILAQKGLSEMEQLVFIPQDIRHAWQDTSGPFELIYLSNILSYCVQEEAPEILQNLETLLSEKGSIAGFCGSSRFESTYGCREFQYMIPREFDNGATIQLSKLFLDTP